ACLFHFEGQIPRSFLINRIVQGNQGLQRRIGPDALYQADLAAGGVKADERRVGAGPFMKGIYRPPVPILSFTELPGLPAVNRLPNPTLRSSVLTPQIGRAHV